ncbi:beta-galactosidase-like isoform X2 [Pomacea canaliculata]|nr:beta-galactosidase-like isoform X2 [Pomacea canaliculata]
MAVTLHGFIAYLPLFLAVSVVGNTFTIDYNNSTFLKDGKPFRYVSGSIHYFRVHPYYWKDRFLKMRAAGINAVQTYVPWNMHEVVPDNYTFTGIVDLPKFLSLAHEAGLLVLLRLGPYICAEVEFGGLPAWLLTFNKDMIVRTSDPIYLARVDKWYSVLLTTIQPYLYENGGPIVMVQIENEYGSYFACDYDYLRFLYKKVRFVLGENVVVYTTDGNTDSYLRCGVINESYATVDFGVTYDPAAAFKAQRDYEPKGPLVNSEFYTGWLDHWGHPHSVQSETAVAKSLDLILAYGANVNLFLFEGGTNFGFWNGGDEPPYMTSVTSRDYDAPLNESGDVTPKFYAVRDIVSKYLELPPYPVPPDTLKASYGQTEMMFVSTVQDALSTLCPEGPIFSTYPLAMEDEKIKHYYGYILYRHKLETNIADGELFTKGVRDRGYVMVNQKPMGMLYRDEIIQVKVMGLAGQYLDIFVENQGRVGYGVAMNFMSKGIIYNVTLDGHLLSGWEIYPIHLEYIQKVERSNRFAPEVSISGTLETPSIYKGKINIPNTADQPRDTNLDMRPWVKGQAFINDFNVGRYWPQKGPQVTLYVPAPTMAIPGDNFLFVLELEYSPCSFNTSCSALFTSVPYLNAPPEPDDY